MERIEAEENIGNMVIYEPYKGCPSIEIEQGVITSVNNRGAFVRYGSNAHSKMTNLSDIELLAKWVK